jgi:hypothetical protein
MSSFKHSPLPIGEVAIRILTLLAGEGTDEVHCELHTKRLEDIADNETYEALSYCWGKQDDEREILVREEGTLRNYPYHVRPNLHAALLAFRHKNAPRTLWIDAICIDQSNSDEKSKQVPLMRRIYEGSTGVIIWLGEKLDDGDPEAAFSLIQKLKNAAVISGGNIPIIRPYSKQDLARYGLPPSLQGRHYYSSLIALCKAEWFKRAWIVQEVAVAKKATIFLGTCGADWMDLIIGLNFSLQAQLPFAAHPAIADVIPVADEEAKYKAGKCTLLSVLLRHRYCGASNESDKVYAFLGLTENALERQPEVRVDYKQKYWSMYRDVTRAIAVHEKKLDILSLPPLPPEFESLGKVLPSWVPDWSVPNEDQAKEFREKMFGSSSSLSGVGRETGSWISRPFCAANSTLYDPNLYPPQESAVLGTRGHIVDIVAATGDTCEPIHLPTELDTQHFARVFRTFLEQEHAVLPGQMWHSSIHERISILVKLSKMPSGRHWLPGICQNRRGRERID